ncbi:MAG: penicillin-binding protein 1A [Thermoanaerobacterales bacterium]|nr:penicillin-binding protein 1A [Thermoanaerobacterales bacterium]
MINDMQVRKKKKRKLNVARLIIVILALLVVLGGGAAFGMIVYSLQGLPAWDPAALDPSNATEIYDKDGHLITQLGKEKRVLVRIQDVPPVIKKAVLAAEDVRFYQHHGIDLRAIGRAAWADITGGGLSQGGSTITQQLVKNSFLTPEKKLKRKIQEAFLAIQVERHFTKDEIFEFYLNQNYFGEGAYGIEMASRTYFGKSVDELQLDEAALLAGLLKAPSAYSPFQDPDAAVARRNTVLDLMAKYGFVSPAEAAAAKTKPLKLNTEKPSHETYPYPYFVDYVTDQLVSRYGEARVFREGLKVYTTLDPKIQKAAEAAMAKASNFPTAKRDKNGVLQPQAALVVVDPHNGHIKAIVGGREHTQLRQWNRATRTTRQPGSAFKPIIAYGPGIEHLGMSPATVIDDIPLKYPKWEPKNYDGVYRGLITIRTAVSLSVNMVAVKVLEKVTTGPAVEFARKLGITTLRPEQEGLAMALGGLSKGVTPLQMAAAYGAFANQGVYVEPTAISQVEDAQGNLIEKFEPAKHRAMKPTTAWLMTDMLRTVVQQGTGTRARLGSRPVAGKTGTTDKRENNWFVGYTPELSCAVWMGYDDATISLPQGCYGGTYTAQIWRDVMSKALEGVPVRGFPRPGGIVSATVDAKSGLLPGPLTPPAHLVTDYFVKGTEPTEVDNTHVLAEICPVSGLLAGEYCPERVAQVRVNTGYEVPPFVKDFAERLPTKTCDVHSLGAPYPGNGTGPSPGLPTLPPVDGETPPDEERNGGGYNSPDNLPPADDRQNDRGTWQREPGLLDLDRILRP